ncbi:cytochrome P450 [Zopfia rhizophila CBS 207.26]|uniref:Cytochrome P450 n=1 Tax=Zopfia rhizophila CBS 207.26 TaxID=1314779 RepID=A0A6A6EKE7_9PEZI|nr:cytochrome P450 [Zopfia rhizophila CBS 207.26]
MTPNSITPFYVGSSVRRTNKWAWSARMFGTQTASIGTVDHDIHRVRRSALNAYFSKRSISSLEPRIQGHVDKLIIHLKEWRGAGKSVNLVDAFTALTADIVGDCGFGSSYGILDRVDFGKGWHTFLMELSRNTHLMKQFPWIYDILRMLPRRLVYFLHPLTRRLFRLQDEIEERIRAAQARHAGQTDDKECETRQILMLDQLIASPHLPAREKTEKRLGEEYLTILMAGTVTTAWTLSVTVYHILANPPILQRLHLELQDLVSGLDRVPTWTDYEKLPYLSAIVNEGLRLNHGDESSSCPYLTIYHSTI